MARTRRKEDFHENSAAQQRRFFGIAFWGSLTVYLVCVVLFIFNPAFISPSTAAIAFLPMIVLMLWCIVRDRADDLKRPKWNKFDLIPIISSLAMLCYLLIDRASLNSNRYLYCLLALSPSYTMTDALQVLTVLKRQQSKT